MLKNYYLNQLQDESIYLIQNDQELAELLQSLSLSPEYHNDITGACIIIGNGDYIAIWLTEDSRYYDLSSIYRPLPVYLSTHQKINPEFLPEYWQESNPLYIEENPSLTNN